MRLKGRKRQKELAQAIDHGRKLMAARQEQEAFEFLEETVHRFPENPELRLLYAAILLALRPDDVGREAVKAIELGSDDPAFLVRAAHLLIWGRQIEVARSCVARAKELATPDFPFMPELINREGLLASIDGEDNTAEEKLRSAAKREPANGSFAIDLARFLASRGREAEAITAIDGALKGADEKDALKRLRQEIEADAGGT